MKLYEYQRSRTFTDLGPSHSNSIFSNFFSPITARPIEAKFHVEPFWDVGMQVCSNGPGHMSKMATMPMYGESFFSGLTMTYFRAKSNLVPFVFVWVNA